MKQMMSDAGVVDELLPFHLASGFPLTGELPCSGQFAPSWRPAVVDREDLWKIAPAIQSKMMAQDPSSMSAEAREHMTQIARDEVSSGWLKGPLTKQDLDRSHGKCWLPSPRFVIQQGAKWRVIDDFSVHQVNQALTQTEKLTLSGVDGIASLTKALVYALRPGTKTIDDLDGGRVNVEPHPAWGGAPVFSAEHLIC